MATLKRALAADQVGAPAALVPLWLSLGPCVELFAIPSDGDRMLSALYRHGLARNVWIAEQGLDRRAANIEECAPWSSHDPGGLVRLASYGLAPSDLSRLRRVVGPYTTERH